MLNGNIWACEEALQKCTHDETSKNKQERYLINNGFTRPAILGRSEVDYIEPTVETGLILST